MSYVEYDTAITDVGLNFKGILEFYLWESNIPILWTFCAFYVRALLRLKYFTEGT
jgi:hypothetical protein